MTETTTPRDTGGAKLCAWCGAPIHQSGVGRSKDYCRRSCRQRAYEQRQVEQQLLAHRRLWDHMASNSSRDETQTPDETSRDETVPAGPPPVPAPATPPRPAPVPVRGSLPPGPSKQKRRRLLPPPPGAQRAEAPTLFEPEAVDGE